jgi:hypothetical protein
VPQSAPAKGPQAKTAAAGGGEDCYICGCLFWCSVIGLHRAHLQRGCRPRQQQQAEVRSVCFGLLGLPSAIDLP